MEKIKDGRLGRVVDWLKQKTEGTCPFCGGHEWTVDDELGSLLAYQHQEPHVQLNRGHTLVLVTCEGCGFTAPFAAKKLEVE